MKISKTDAIKQAKWEIALEAAEAAVEREKEKLRAKKKSWFKYRIKLEKINDE